MADNDIDSIKSQALKEFNNQFFEFMDDIARIFPTYPEIKTSRMFVSMLSTFKPACIIIFVNDYIIKPYGSHIKKGDMDFFSNNDFSKDSNVGDSTYILDKIKTVTNFITMMTVSEKETIAVYLQNMAALCEIYFSSS